MSWQANGCKFTGQQAKAYCRAGGMRAISLDNQSKVDHFLGLARGTK